jgi:hypothetical protein
MFEQMLARRRLRAAAKLYARRLEPQLIRDYGASAHYTPAQIQASIARAELSQSHIELAYAAFLPEESFRQVAQPANVDDYEAFNRLLAACKPSPQPAWSPESGGSGPPATAMSSHH